MLRVQRLGFGVEGLGFAHGSDHPKTTETVLCQGLLSHCFVFSLLVDIVDINSRNTQQGPHVA